MDFGRYDEYEEFPLSDEPGDGFTDPNEEERAEQDACDRAAGRQ